MPNPCTLRLDAIRMRMAALQLTQQDLAHACGIDVRTVQRWFAGHAVSLENAEQVASLVGVGTAEIFHGVPKEAGLTISGRLRLVQRMLGARDSAFAQVFRLTQEYFDTVLQAVYFDAHPVTGFVSRHPIDAAAWHGFSVFTLTCPEEHAEIVVRCQLGRHFGYALARLRLRQEQAYLVEQWQTHSMVATRGDHGEITLWLWVGHEIRELMFVCDREFSAGRLPIAKRDTCALDEPGMQHALCVRPHAVNLRSAALPMGYDRITGERAGRVDVPIDWDAMVVPAAE